MQEIDSKALRSKLTSTDEIALIDVREEGVFSKEHIFLGSCIPASHLEFRAEPLMSRKSVPVIITDGGDQDDGLAERAAVRLAEMGYKDVSVLAGGVAGWRDSGFEVFSGVNVPSKAFGELVEHYYETPRIPAADLNALKEAGENVVILDSRPMDEFNRMSIPDGVDCPGAELVYRVGMMAPDPTTMVVVNCAGRTRSIIGAQSLINAGIPNKVMALKDGTMGWELQGFTCARDETKHAPQPEGEVLKTAMTRAGAVATRFGVKRASADQVESWLRESQRTTFLLDVRTDEEFVAGHWQGAHHAPGGQLVQATDEYVGVRNARIVLADTADGVRATMTASWLVQLGYQDVHVLTDQPGTPEIGSAATAPALFKLFASATSAELQAARASGVPIQIIDLADSLTFRKGHIPGALWGVRSRISQWAASLKDAGTVFITSPDGRLAHYAAHELAATRPELAIRVLEGGTQAWKARSQPIETGIENTLTEIDDVWWKPYESQGRVRQAMEDYLTWEVGLVEQVQRDGLVDFRKFD